MQVDMRQLVLVIASAVDLVGVDDTLHGRRVGIMARECAKQLGWDAVTQGMIFDTGVLHDCGVSSTRVHSKLVHEIDWAGADQHCAIGYALLKDFAPLAHLAPIIRHHHTRWDVLVAKPVPVETATYANLIYLVDRVDVQAAAYYADSSLLLRAGEIRETVARQRGTIFSPELVDGFLAASDRESFWLQLNADYIAQYVVDLERVGEARAVSLKELKQFALIIAAIVDAKSPFTAEHSRGVARLSRLLGELSGFSGDRLERIEIAALLHDIGKLQMPDELLESTEPYSATDRAVMKRHSFATHQVLRRIGALEEVAFWAAAHHESLDGSGYPFRLTAAQLPTEARIIKVADVFQALAQDRPYRKPMPVEDILVVLRRMAAANEVDSALVGLVTQHVQQCHEAAVGAATPLPAPGTV